MELEALKNLIKNTQAQRNNFNTQFNEALRYYQTKTDITNRNNGKPKIKKDGAKAPLRSADNRVPSNFYQLLVDQEAGYLTTVPPAIDVGDKSENHKVVDTLGDNFSRVLNNLLIDASNAGTAWLHYWIDEDNNFRYAVVPPSQITPIYATTLDNKLLGCLRSYRKLDPETGKFFIVHEYWTDKEAKFYKAPSSDIYNIEPYASIASYDLTAGYETGVSNVYKYDFDRVPFIPFIKNKYKLPELTKTKGLIDAYDDIYNGFLNDISDVQQVVLVLKNFGSTDLKSFMRDLKVNKAVKFNTVGNDDKSGIEKLTIDIPVEARDDVLATTRENIFLYGQGVDPANFKSSNASGVAIKMLYSHLELKAGFTESYFNSSISELVRAILHYYGDTDSNSRPIELKWTRNQVSDNLDQAQAVAQIAPYTSKQTIAKSNPFVVDWQKELEYQKEDIQNSDGFFAAQKFDDEVEDND